MTLCYVLQRAAESSQQLVTLYGKVNFLHADLAHSISACCESMTWINRENPRLWSRLFSCTLLVSTPQKMGCKCFFVDKCPQWEYLPLFLMLIAWCFENQHSLPKNGSFKQSNMTFSRVLMAAYFLLHILSFIPQTRYFELFKMRKFT